MSQGFITTDLDVDTSGLELVTLLETLEGAVNSHHKGSTAPTYKQAGMIWLDDTATPWYLKIYDGANWITIGTVNATTDQFRPSFSTMPYSVAPAEGRLTLESGVAVSPTNQAAKTTLYYTPYNGNQIWLYASSLWTPITFAEISITLASLTAALPYDVFVYNNAGTATLELLAWTNTTTRATGLSTQDGIKTKSGDATRRYLGTICIKATGQSEDSLTDRLVWNNYNRVYRPMTVLEATDNWTYTTATMRQARAQTTNRLAFVRGVDEDAVEARLLAMFGNASVNVAATSAIGLDSNTTPATGSTIAQANAYTAGTSITNNCSYSGLPGIGYHELRWLEWSQALGTTTWYGDNGGIGLQQSGLNGQVIA